jgi:prepilin-type N-terminal cleavage/methylation domain-containing protein
MRSIRVRAFTLIEMLVAMTASLILLGSVMTIFQILGETVRKSRQMGDLDSQICSFKGIILNDLAGVTARRSAAGLDCPANAGVGASGYFEIVEGPNSDLLDFSVNPPYDRSTNISGPTPASNDRIVGDTDDLLFFTTQSVSGNPFYGKFDDGTIESPQAEVAYFCTPTPDTANPTLYTLRRRQLLIVGSFSTPTPPFDSNSSQAFSVWGNNWVTFLDRYDLSVRLESGRIILNNGADLLARTNRFAHHPLLSGTNVSIAKLNLAPGSAVWNVLPLAGSRSGEDILFTNVLTFDVKVVDNKADVRERRTANTSRLQPGDRDFWSSGATAEIAPAGNVYVDLGFNAGRPNGVAAVPWGYFCNYGSGTGTHVLSGSAGTARTYDTWTTLYMTNSLSDDGNLVVDADEGPPYPTALPGIQITLRLYEPSSKSIRQTTITQSFQQ